MTGNDLPLLRRENDEATDIHINGSGPPAAGDLSICVSVRALRHFYRRRLEVREVRTIDELIEVSRPQASRRDRGAPGIQGDVGLDTVIAPPAPRRGGMSFKQKYVLELLGEATPAIHCGSLGDRARNVT